MIQFPGESEPHPLVGQLAPLGDEDRLSKVCLWRVQGGGGGHGRGLLVSWPPDCRLTAPPSDATRSLDSLSENKIGDEGVEQLSATFPRLKALETLK